MANGRSDFMNAYCMISIGIGSFFAWPTSGKHRGPGNMISCVVRNSYWDSTVIQSEKMQNNGGIDGSPVGTGRLVWHECLRVVVYEYMYRVVDL